VNVRRLAAGPLKFSLGLLLALAGAGLLASCSKPGAAPDKGKAAGRPVPVLAEVAVTKEVPVEIRTFGSAETMSSVAVKAQVGEVLKTVHVKKGQYVKKDELLFTIDPRTFEASLKQSQATLARDQALLGKAKKDAIRDEDLKSRGITSETDYETSKANAEALAAAVQSDQAAVDNAQIQVEHCTIRSPVEGRVGNVLVNEGNVVKANDSTLIVINQMRPIQVFFTIPQSDLPAVRKYMAEGKIAVLAAPAREDGEPEVGELTFVDNAVDKATGSVQLGALFANPNERLWPGQYVHVQMNLASQKDATVIPVRAVQTGRDILTGREGKYVYVIKPDNTVENRKVTISRTVDDQAVVEKGVAAGEQVVTDGHLRLTNGSKVEIKTQLSPTTMKDDAASGPRAGKPGRGKGPVEPTTTAEGGK
jgi:multidrug efflux system membrane fusion protein